MSKLVVERSDSRESEISKSLKEVETIRDDKLPRKSARQFLKESRNR